MSSPIQVAYLKRSGSSFSEITSIPQPSRITYSTDVSQFSGTFDIELELGPGETFGLQSHDWVEFYFLNGGSRFQIGACFVEDILSDDHANQSLIHFNGRDLLGQLINVPLRKQIQQGGVPFETFLRQAIDQGYLQSYCAARSRDPVLSSGGGMFRGSMVFITDQFMTSGSLIQQYADLAINLVYQNRLGQMEVYGRKTAGLPIPKGQLVHGFGRSNVIDLSTRDNFSKVASECTVFWTSEQALLDGDNPTQASNKQTNTDARVAGRIYQPVMKTFSAGDVRNLNGGVNPDQRIADIANSTIRRSMRNVGAVIVTNDQPFFTDPLTGAITPFEVQQLWGVRSERQAFEKTMRIAGLHYTQAKGDFMLQASLVEQDTLI